MQKIFNNISWIIGARVFQMIVSGLIGILSARYLGPNNYGLIGYIQSFVALFTAIANLGINGVIVNELLDNKEKQGMVLGTSLNLRIISSILSAIGVILLVSFFNDFESTYVNCSFILTLGLIAQSFDIFNYFYQSRLQSRVTAIITVATSTIVSFLRLYMIITGQGIEWFAFTYSLDFILVAFFLYIAVKSTGISLSFDKNYGYDLLKNSYHFIISGISVAIYGQMDKIMLKTMIGEYAVGYYSAAYAVSTIWVFVLAAIIDSIRPMIISQKINNDILYENTISKLYGIVCLLCISVSIIFTLFSDGIIYILYGKEFIASSNILSILTWSVLFSYLGVARNIWLVCENKQSYIKYLSAIGVFVNFVLNYFFIRQYGAAGAAAATLLTQACTGFLIPFIIPELRHNSILIIKSFSMKNIKELFALISRNGTS